MKIEYETEEIDEEWESELIEMMQELGYEFVSSGYNTTTNMRDINFEPVVVTVTVTKILGVRQ